MIKLKDLLPLIDEEMLTTIDDEKGKIISRDTPNIGNIDVISITLPNETVGEIRIKIKGDFAKQEQKGFKNLVETNESKLTYGTSYFGHSILTTLRKLKKAFGKYERPGDKTSAKFCLQIDDVIFTIYDYKEYGKTPYRNQDLEFRFNIGGFSQSHTHRALQFIKEKIGE